MNVDPFDPKFDTSTPSPELVDEFVRGLGPAFAEANEATLALDALRVHGWHYLTSRERELVAKYAPSKVGRE